MPTTDARINQQLFDNSSDLILVTDKHEKLIRISPSAIDITGRYSDELVDTDLKDFIYPEDWDFIQEEMRVMKTAHDTRHFRCRCFHKDGTVIPLYWTGVWSESEGQYFFIGREIVELKIAEGIANVSEILNSLTKKLAHDTRLVMFLRMPGIFIIEVSSLINAMWASYVLFTPPSNFATFSASFQLVRDLEAHEVFWASYAGFNALLLFISIFITYVHESKSSGLILFRCLGLVLSGTFWFLMGLSTVIGNPDALFGFTGIVLGLASWWATIRLVQ